MGETEDVLVTLQTLLCGARCLHPANIRKLAMAVRTVNLGNLCNPALARFTCAACPTRSSARSGESSVDKPTPLAAASAGRLHDALESVRLEQANRPHVCGSLVNAIAFGVHRVTFNHDCSAGARMLNCAIQQVVHQPPAPESHSHPEADRRPRLRVINMRDGTRIDEGTIRAFRCDRAPASNLAVHEREDSWTRLALTQAAHVLEPAKRVETGVPVRHAHAPALRQQRREVVPAPDGRKYLDGHGTPCI